MSGLAAARQQPGNLLLLKVTVLCLAPAPAQVCITTSRTDTSSCAVIVTMVRVASWRHRHICLRSRPVDPDVVCPSVCVSLATLKIPSDEVTK